MGITHIEATIANPARPKRSVRLSFLVDSGAFYSVVSVTDAAGPATNLNGESERASIVEFGLNRGRALRA